MGTFKAILKCILLCKLHNKYNGSQLVAETTYKISDVVGK